MADLSELCAPAAVIDVQLIGVGLFVVPNAHHVLQNFRKISGVGRLTHPENILASESELVGFVAAIVGHCAFHDIKAR